jgi:hypothetical protein
MNSLTLSCTESVYYYTSSFGIWSRQSKISAKDGAVGDLFGSSVATNGNYGLIGAKKDGNAGASAGIYTTNLQKIIIKTIRLIFIMKLLYYYRVGVCL